MEVSHYGIVLHLSPREGKLSARVQLDYRLKSPTSELSFTLHRSLRPSAVTGDSVAGFDWAIGEPTVPFITDGATLTVRFLRTLPAGETCRLEFAYAGLLGIANQWQVNRLTPEWVELGLYAPWFPLRLDEQFTYRVEVTADESYELIGLGTTEQRDGRWLISGDEPGEDITILAAPRFLRVARPNGSGSVAAYYTSPVDLDLATSTAEDGLRALGFFDRWLGAEGRAVAELKIVVAPRVIGGAYVRPGLVVMSRPEDGEQPDRLGQFGWLAHEFSHLWWMMAPHANWEDWLNESFAEFSSLTAIREFYGEAVFSERLAMMRAKAQDLPPIIGLPRNHEQAHSVLYAKGCVLLGDLEQRIGRDQMTAFLRRTLQHRVRSTAELLALLAEAAGDEAARVLDVGLRV